MKVFRRQSTVLALPSLLLSGGHAAALGGVSAVHIAPALYTLRPSPGGSAVPFTTEQFLITTGPGLGAQHLDVLKRRRFKGLSRINEFYLYTYRIQ